MLPRVKRLAGFFPFWSSPSGSPSRSGPPACWSQGPQLPRLLHLQPGLLPGGPDRRLHELRQADSGNRVIVLQSERDFMTDITTEAMKQHTDLDSLGPVEYFVVVERKGGVS